MHHLSSPKSIIPQNEEKAQNYLDFFDSLKLLLKEQLTIAEISARLGFCDQFYFSRRFKQKFGETPSSFRKRLPDEFI